MKIKQQLSKPAPYWASMFGTALAGGFIAVDRFAFNWNNADWIAFSVAIAAAVLSLGGVGLAALRANGPMAATSGLAAAIAAVTIMETRVFDGSTALWIAFAGGLALLATAVRALALHEATIERIVHELDVRPDGAAVAVSHQRSEQAGGIGAWLFWLGNTAIGLAGGFVVASTFVWGGADGATLSPRWLDCSIGMIAAAIGLLVLAEESFVAYRNGLTVARRSKLGLTVLGVATGGVLIGSMAIITVPYNVRWTAFGLGAGMVGVALAALIAHEFVTERVHHELTVRTSRPARADDPSMAAA